MQFIKIYKSKKIIKYNKCKLKNCHRPMKTKNFNSKFLNKFQWLAKLSVLFMLSLDKLNVLLYTITNKSTFFKLLKEQS